VTAEDGKEWVFSNPIHFVREVPLAGVGFGRVAARWEDLRLFRADRASLRAAEYSALPRTLVLTLDEEPAGQGSVMIDCGGFGMPDVIQGAQNTVFSAGVLTLSGFGGMGSSVTLGWGVTAAELVPAKPGEVRLDPVRPNPFRRFAVATLHLPRKTECRVEVVDVGGRVVRALVDGVVGEGARTLYWDGIAEGGTRVADGVYFLRAIVDGRAYVRKFVKIQ
jgi:hypothetical protein